MDPLIDLELGRSHLDDLRAEARAHGAQRLISQAGARRAGVARRTLGAALIEAGARLTGERVTRAPLGRTSCAHE